MLIFRPSYNSKVLHLRCRLLLSSFSTWAGRYISLPKCFIKEKKSIHCLKGIKHSYLFRHYLRFRVVLWVPSSAIILLHCNRNPKVRTDIHEIHISTFHTKITLNNVRIPIIHSSIYSLFPVTSASWILDLFVVSMSNVILCCSCSNGHIFKYKSVSYIIINIKTANMHLPEKLITKML